MDVGTLSNLLVRIPFFFFFFFFRLWTNGEQKEDFHRIFFINNYVSFFFYNNNCRCTDDIKEKEYRYNEINIYHHLYEVKMKEGRKNPKFLYSSTNLFPKKIQLILKISPKKTLNE